jgi:hypothetical protein
MSAIIDIFVVSEAEHNVIAPAIGNAMRDPGLTKNASQRCENVLYPSHDRISRFYMPQCVAVCKQPT